MRVSADMLATDNGDPGTESRPTSSPKVYANSDGPAVAGAFVCDEAGMMVAQVLAARGLAARVQNGGIAAAIEYVSAGGSPRLMIVDLSQSPSPMADIDALAEVCEPGITVVALGTANDVTLFRDLLTAGVTDYLVKPLDRAAFEQAVGEAIDSAQTATGGDKAGKVITVIGARGGVGATSVAVNVAWTLAHERKQRVAILDLDLQFGAVALALDVEPGRGLRETLENPDRIDSLFIASAAVNAAENLYVLGAEEPLEQLWAPGAEALDLLIAELKQNFDCVVIDLPRSAALSHGAVLKASTDVVLVTDRSLIGMRDTMRLAAMLKNVATETEPLVVANRVGADKNAEIPTREFERGTEVKIDLSLPEDPKAMAMAWHSGKAVASVVKRGKLNAAIAQLAGRVAPAAPEDDNAKRDASLLRRVMGK